MDLILKIILYFVLAYFPTTLEHEIEFYPYEYSSDELTSIDNEPEIDHDDLYWLALNIYHEAGNQHTIGKIAVGVVTLNRVKSDLYEDTIETVVKERKQFSWYHLKRNHIPHDQKLWKECLRIAEMLLTPGYNGDIMKHLANVTHYHATYVRPKWSKTYVKVIQIGDHIFYRKPKKK